MKKCSNGFLIFLFVTVLLCCSTFARLLPPKTGSEQKLKNRGSPNEVPLTAGEGEDFSGGMESEQEEYCDEKDEECLRRRMLSDAHLDYIYSQSHHGP